MTAPQIRRPNEIPTQDLTAELVRDWLDSACIDAFVDEDVDGVCVSVDGTQAAIRLDVQRGIVYLAVSIACASGDARDPDTLFSTVNRVNRDAIMVRVVARGLHTDEPWMRYEHEHFALDGNITRRQLVRIVRRVVATARDCHRIVHELVAERNS